MAVVRKNKKSNKVKVAPNPIITSHYIKNQDFRTSLVTSVIGGVTVTSMININFCSDRVPIPLSITNEIEKNNLGKEIERSGKNGIVKEVQFGILLDVNASKSLIKFLEDHVKIIEQSIVQKK